MADHEHDALDEAELAYLERRTQSLTDLGADADERAVEAALRPRSLDEVIGQQRVREQLALVLEAARARGRTPDHVLLSGPPGLGKTTLAMIIAAEMSSPLRLTSGPAITHAGDLAAILSGLNEGDVLFVDEIHRMSRPAEEMLYLAMEDFRVDVVIGKGPGATAIPLEIPPFTLVGATTRAGLLPGPLRDRFGFTAHLEFYEPAELDQIVRRSAGLLEVHAEPTAPPRSPPDRAAHHGSPTGCCAGSATTPRCVATAWSPSRSAHRALDLFEVDQSGLDRLDRAVLDALCRRFGGGPVGHQHARGRGGGGARDRRGGRRAVPGAQRPARAHPPRTGRDTGRLGPPRPECAGGRAVRGRGDALRRRRTGVSPPCLTRSRSAVTLHRRWRARLLVACPASNPTCTRTESPSTCLPRSSCW